jgi:hypothetical protein
MCPIKIIAIIELYYYFGESPHTPSNYHQIDKVPLKLSKIVNAPPMTKLPLVK